MATLFDIVTGNSTLPVQSGNTFWDHLNNQAGGGGIVQIFGEMEVFLMADLEVELDPELEAELDSEFIVTLDPDLIAEVCD